MEIKISKTYTFTGGDEMSHYKDVHFDGYQPTLEEFVNWILKNEPGEWGLIEDISHPEIDMIKGREIKFPTTIVEYSHGHIVSLGENYEQYKNHRINLTYMSGGWSRMDYTIKFE